MVCVAVPWLAATCSGARYSLSNTEMSALRDTRYSAVSCKADQALNRQRVEC